jgi:uncharacterized protein YdeI (YjbR/CyaY-like superfamily)
MNVIFFESPAKLNAWFSKHHVDATELWLGFYKLGSGKRSVTWPESVDEALCFGWIDGVRKRIDEESYKIRFTPRKRGSIWSAVNLRRVQELELAGRMKPAGLNAFAARKEKRTGIYAYEQANAGLDQASETKLKANKHAWEFWQAQPAGYRKLLSWRITSAKKDETRARRLQQLIEACERGERL